MSKFMNHIVYRSFWIMIIAWGTYNDNISIVFMPRFLIMRIKNLMIPLSDINISICWYIYWSKCIIDKIIVLVIIKLSLKILFVAMKFILQI